MLRVVHPHSPIPAKPSPFPGPLCLALVSKARLAIRLRRNLHNDSTHQETHRLPRRRRLWWSSRTSSRHLPWQFHCRGPRTETMCSERPRSRLIPLSLRMLEMGRSWRAGRGPQPLFAVDPRRAASCVHTSHRCLLSAAVAGVGSYTVHHDSTPHCERAPRQQVLHSTLSSLHLARLPLPSLDLKARMPDFHLPR